MPSWKKVITSGSSAALQSLTVTNGITGSLFGTASYAVNGGVTQLLAGPNITLSPTNGLGQVTISSLSGSGGGGFNTATGSYGSFYDTTTQTNPVGNIPRSMSLDTTDITNGVSVSGSTNPFNTYIKTQNAGVYDIQFSAQVEKTDSGTDEIVIWLRKNGTDLTDTATTITLNGNNDKQVAAWNWFVNSAANDYYQIIWYSADTDLRLLAEAAGGGHPGIPSVIVTANRVDQFLSNTGSFSGSFTGQFTGSLFGTASFASTASFLGSTTNAFIQNGNSFGALALLGTNDNNSLALETNGTTRMFISSSGNVGIGTTTPTKGLQLNISASDDGFLIAKSGSANNIFRVTMDGTNDRGEMFLNNGGTIVFAVRQASNPSYINTGNNFGIGTTTPSAKLDVSGSAIISGSFTVTPGTVREFQVNTTGVDIGNLITDTHTVTGSLSTSGSLTVNGNTIITGSLAVGGTTILSGSLPTISGSILKVIGSGSTQPIFTVQGSQGELFSVTDSLSGSLFSVNDISGLPILEVFSDNTTLIGNYLDPMLVTTAKNVLTNSGSFTVYSLPTASYDTAFFDYSVRSGSNARAGQIMAIQSASVVNYTETTTMDFGSTSGLSLGVFISGSNMVLTGSAATTAWTIKTIIRSI